MLKVLMSWVAVMMLFVFTGMYVISNTLKFNAESKASATTAQKYSGYISDN
jgi:hypothetical protein